MKIIYGSNSRIPTERAHGIQVVEMCNAFAEEGHEVELVVPNKRNKFGDEDPYDFYQIAKTFKIKNIPSFNLFVGTKFNFYVQGLVNSCLFAIYAIGRKPDIYYIKDERVAYVLSFFRKNIVWEPHVGNVDFIARKVGKSAMAIVALTEGVRQDLIKNGISAEKIMVAHDAVRLDMFHIDESKEKLREDLCLPQGKRIAMYVGHLFDWKGVDVLADAMHSVVDNVVCVFVGGLPSDIERMKKKYSESKNIVFVGNQMRERIPQYLAAADMLVLPNSGKYKISRSYTSPLKLFEYMASRRPIVASKLPSLMEVLNEENSFLVESDNSDILADVICGIDPQNDVTQKKVGAAYALAQQKTWRKRAQSICVYIEEKKYGSGT